MESSKINRLILIFFGFARACASEGSGVGVRRGLNQAGVAVGEKPVELGNGVRIGGFDAIETGEGCDEHHERRARQVEIGQQQVDGAEAIAGQDEQARLAREFVHFTGFGGGAFEEAQARRADRGDAAAPPPRGRLMYGGKGISPWRTRASRNAAPSRSKRSVTSPSAPFTATSAARSAAKSIWSPGRSRRAPLA